MKKQIKNRYWEEYKDLYEQAQKSGKYKMFLFDVVGSKKIFSNNYALFKKVITFVDAVTNDLLNLEKKLNKKILHRHIENFKNYNIKTDKDKVVLCVKQHGERTKDLYRTDSLNPLFWLGDLMHFIIECDSIPDKTFYEIFEKNKKEIIPNINFHHKSGYYETDVWAESGSKFSRIYCIPVLEYLAKNKEKTNSKLNEDEIVL